MSNLSDRISYLRGLAEGLKTDESSNEGKLITQLIEVLSEVIDDVDDLHDEVDELNDYVESIDEDLSELEGDFDDDDDDDDDDDEDFDFDFDEDDEEDDDEEEDDEEDEFDFFAREDDLGDEEEDGVGMYVGCICPECHGMFCIDARIDEDNLLYTCPHCGKNVEARPMDNDNVPIAKAVEDEDDE